MFAPDAGPGTISMSQAGQRQTLMPNFAGARCAPPALLSIVMVPLRFLEEIWLLKKVDCASAVPVKFGWEAAEIIRTRSTSF